MDKKLKRWLHEWTWTKNPLPLTKDIEHLSKPYRPNKPVLLYRVETKHSSKAPLQSWTYEKGMADFMLETAEQTGNKEGLHIVQKVIHPKSILIDISKLPCKEEFVPSEVIVNKKWMDDYGFY